MDRTVLLVAHQAVEYFGRFKCDQSATVMVLVLFEQLRSCNSGNVTREKYSPHYRTRNLSNSSKINFKLLSLSFFHPLTVCTLSLLMFTRGKTPRQGSHPTAGEAHCCTSTTGRLSLSSLSLSLSTFTQNTVHRLSPRPPPTSSCRLHRFDAK